MRQATWAFWMLFPLGLACGGATGAMKGDDSRAGAADLAWGALAMDEVDAAGDAVDFLRIDLATPETVAFRIDWDRPDLKARVRLLDAKGKRIRQITRAAGRAVDVIEPLHLDEGTYYLEIRATKGASPYAVAVIPASDLGVDAIPRPE